jgi:hypothetical protein
MHGMINNVNVNDPSSYSGAYCGINGHVRVWAGGPDAKPSTCACGAMRYEEHRCLCGNIHEKQVAVRVDSEYNGINSYSAIAYPR